MIVTAVRIDGQRYVLDPSQDAATLQTQLLAARAGTAAFSTFITSDQVTITVLMTPATTVCFDTVDDDQDRDFAAEVGEVLPSDFDEYTGDFGSDIPWARGHAA